LISFTSIHQAPGKHEFSRSEISKIINDVINSNPEENKKGDELIKCLQRDFGPELDKEKH
jgi:Glu-tRNA(Gln) amidotransferase subunit E-like FAD-binding protein